ncbi:MAG: glycerophosphodiester phosphodiesterase [Ruminococcaceae bacterium]|nr:glycerophosphodiester phosphodiesterase [Oscillospiraceae bacterium]
MIVLAMVLAAIVLLELFLLALQCRRGHPQWKTLRAFRYAHRGYHDKPQTPENSMAAFRRAIANFYGVELDVHLMRDGNLAVIHDASLLRTAGVDVLVEDLTAEELKQYRLEGTQEQIPLFSEVLELFEGKMPLIVELKAERGNYNELAEAACKMLDQYRVSYCIESFDPRCLMWLKKNRPEICRGQLSQAFLRHGDGGGQSKLTLFVLQHLLTNFLTKPDFIAYRFEDRNNLCLQWCRKVFKVQEINWTITTKEEMEASEQAGNLVIFERFDPRG